MSSGAIVMQTGQIELLKELFGTTQENWSLRLFSTSHTPGITDTLSTYVAIEASFTGYSALPLTRTVSGTTWAVAASATGTAINAAGDAIATYHAGTPQAWSATSAQTIYGHFWSGVTSGVGILAQLWTSSISLVNPSTLNLTPVLELGAIGG